MRNYILRLLAFSVFGAALGCGRVEVDRSASWTPDGKQVGIQRDEKGVFVAKPGDGKPTQLLAPDETVLAVSTPMANPKNGRLLFTTAHEENPSPDGKKGGFAAKGRTVSIQPVIYRVWIRNSDAKESDKPTLVFEARTDHIGYVAGNLAVRWSPDGKSIYYVDRTKPERHSVFAYDFESKEKKQVFPQSLYRVIFDFSPDGTSLAVIGGFRWGDYDTTGIWVTSNGKWDDWWRVTGSEQLANGPTSELIENLRATRPIWNQDGHTFAFVSKPPAKKQDDGKAKPEKNAVTEINDDAHTVQLVEVKTKAVRPIAESKQRVFDLGWSRTGDTLGFVEVDAKGIGRLRFWSDKFGERAGMEEVAAQRFLGFSRKTDQFAYVSPQAPHSKVVRWPLALVPVPGGSNQVWVSTLDRPQDRRLAFEGMRVMYPSWSPKEDKLSVSLSFAPPYQNVFSGLGEAVADAFGDGRAGESVPAVIEFASGEIAWMPTSAAESVQAGHYFLRKHDYAKAAEWYARGEKEAGPVLPPTSRGEWFDRLSSQGDGTLYHAICLDKLGRGEEAAAYRKRFEETVLPPPVEGAAWVKGEDSFTKDLSPAQLESLWFFLREIKAVEIYLAAGAGEEGVLHLRASLDAAANARVRFAASASLGQLYLALDRRSDYIETTTNDLIPSVAELWTSPIAKEPATDAKVPKFAMVGAFFLPLASKTFLEDVPKDVLAKYLPRWQEARAKVDDPIYQLGVDLVLRGVLARLGSTEAADVETRIKSSHVIADVGIDEDIDAWLKGVFEIPSKGANR